MEGLGEQSHDARLAACEAGLQEHDELRGAACHKRFWLDSQHVVDNLQTLIYQFSAIEFRLSADKPASQHLQTGDQGRGRRVGVRGQVSAEQLLNVVQLDHGGGPHLQRLPHDQQRLPVHHLSRRAQSSLQY